MTEPTPTPAPTETTALLRDSRQPTEPTSNNNDNNNNNNNNDNGEEITQRTTNEQLLQKSKRLNRLILFTSITALILLLVTYILITIGPFWNMWWLANSIQPLSFVIFVDLLFQLINHENWIDIPLCIIFDVLFTGFTLFWTFSLAAAPDWSRLGSSCNSIVSGRNCEVWDIVTKVFLALSIVGGLVIGISHIIFFIVRCKVIKARGYWTQRPSSDGEQGFRFPVGQLTFEFTIKLLRQQEPQGVLTSGSGSGNQGAEAQSGVVEERRAGGRD